VVSQIVQALVGVAYHSDRGTLQVAAVNGLMFSGRARVQRPVPGLGISRETTGPTSAEVGTGHHSATAATALVDRVLEAAGFNGLVNCPAEEAAGWVPIDPAVVDLAQIGQAVEA
jgi:hypothetical protein